MALLMAIAFVCLGYRLVDLQVLQDDKLRHDSEDSTRRLFLRAPKRGDIRDIRGNVLAGSVFVKTVCANPAIVGEHRSEVARVIAPLLEMSDVEVFHRLQPRLTTNATGRPVVDSYVLLKRNVPTETWERIQAALRQLPLEADHATLSKAEQRFYAQLRQQGIYAEEVEDQVRVYPNHQLAAHVLGYVGPGLEMTPKGKVDQLEGHDGIEHTMNTALKGVMGWRST